MRDERLYLADMLEAVRDLKTFVAGAPPDAFEQNRMIRWAAVQRLMTLGEAAARVSDALKSRHPEVPWAELTAFRNVLVHGYFSLRWEIVREAAVNQAPGLEPHIERILKTEFVEE